MGRERVQWEYKVYMWDPKGKGVWTQIMTWEDCEKPLNALGIEGWEIVSIRWTGGDQPATVVLKRLRNTEHFT